MEKITLTRAQKIVDDWIKEYGVKYFSPLTNLGMLAEEVGEVSRIITRQYGDQSFKKSDQKYDLADELSDVLFIIICLANQTNIDLNKAFINNLAKKTGRDKTRHKNNPKLVK